MKIYTKKRGAHPDLGDPVCLRKGATIEVRFVVSKQLVVLMERRQDVCNGIHRSLAENFKYGLVWGKSSKFSPHAQKVSLNHQVADEDVVTSRLFLCPFSYASANHDDQYLPSKHSMAAQPMEDQRFVRYMEERKGHSHCGACKDCGT